MSVLVLRLAGVQQSWSTYRYSANFTATERVPARSALLGLLAACLGAKRGQYPGWLEQTQFLVRVDRRGRVEQDYQTVNPFDQYLGEIFWRQEFLAGRVRSEKLVENRVVQAVVPLRGVGKSVGGKGGEKNRVAWTIAGKLTSSSMRRQFLADAEFVLAVTHPTHLQQLCDAVRNPVFATYLGRKAFVPTFPFVLGASEQFGALEFLQKFPTVGEFGLRKKVVEVKDSVANLRVFPVLEDRNLVSEVAEVEHYKEHVEFDGEMKSPRERQLIWLKKNLHR